jgi:hypothetical protein
MQQGPLDYGSAVDPGKTEVEFHWAIPGVMDPDDPAILPACYIIHGNFEVGFETQPTNVAVSLYVSNHKLCVIPIRLTGIGQHNYNIWTEVHFVPFLSDLPQYDYLFATVRMRCNVVENRAPLTGEVAITYAATINEVQCEDVAAVMDLEVRAALTSDDPNAGIYASGTFIGFRTNLGATVIQEP